MPCFKGIPEQGNKDDNWEQVTRKPKKKPFWGGGGGTGEQTNLFQGNKETGTMPW